MHLHAMGQVASCGGCFAGFAPSAPAASRSVPAPVASATVADNVEPVPASSGTQCNSVASNAAVKEKAVPTKPESPWDKNAEGVVDISPDDNRIILLRAPKSPEKVATPSDGALVTFECEVLAFPSMVVLMPGRQQTVRCGEGTGELPEELELAIPRLSKGLAVELLCRDFGRLGTAEGGDWQELNKYSGQEILMKLTLTDFEDLHIATLSAADRLKYARGRKDAGGRFFKRSRFTAALERYSLASELLTYVDDIKDAAMQGEAKDVKMQCEGNAAACLLKLEKWREAEAVCSAVLKQYPSNEKARFRRGKARLQQGDWGGSEADLRQVLEANPQNAEARQLLASVRKLSKGSEKERKVYGKMF